MPIDTQNTVSVGSFPILKNAAAKAVSYVVVNGVLNVTRAGGEKADDEKGVRSDDGNAQSGEGNSYASLEKQGTPRVTSTSCTVSCAGSRR